MDTKSDFAEHLRMVLEQRERAQQELDRARKEFEHAQRVGAFWDRLVDCLSRGHPAHALLLLRREAEFVRELKASDEPTVERLRDLHRVLQQHASVAAGRIAREFPPAARSAGIEIDSTSRHPAYTFNQGFLRLDMDERNLSAKVAPRDGNVIVIGLDLCLVIDTIRSEQARLFQRDVDLQSFLRSLYTAYMAVLRAEDRPEGDEVPLRRVTNRLAKNLNRFAADECNIDLARLLQRGDVVVDGKRVHLNHTRDRRQGMLLYGLESGGYVGFISFKTEK